jgi:AbiV family abortive infection protein
LIVTNVPIPDLDLLGDLANEAAANARRLLADANILINRRRWPTAYSLAILAFEEAGKAWLCINAMMAPDEVRPQFPFGELAGGHLWKLAAAHGMADMLAFIRGGPDAPSRIGQALDVVESLARADNRAKQRGLYADVEDGAVWNPSKVSENEARRMVSAVRDLLDYGAPLVSPEFISWMVRMPDDVRPERDAFFTRFFDVVAQGGYEAAMAFIEDEISKLPGLAEMLEEDAQRLALDRFSASSQVTKARSKGRRAGAASTKGPVHRKRQRRRLVELRPPIASIH